MTLSIESSDNFVASAAAPIATGWSEPDATVSLSSNPTGVLPASAVITTGNASTALPINVPSGITSLTITGSIGGIPVSATVPVQ